MKINTLAALLPVAALLVAPTLIAPAQAGILKKHPVAAGLGAGLVAHHMAKKGAAGRAANGQRPNMAERHPMASGILAAGAMHHHLKK